MPDQLGGQRCAGCGTPEGEPRVSYRERRTVYGIYETIREEHLPAKLRATALADFEPRLMCQRCRRLAGKINQQLNQRHLALIMKP